MDALSNDDQLVGELTDADLLTAPRAVAAQRFGEFYERHVDAVLSFHQRRTGCAQTAADLTAETFASALSSRRRFHDTGAPARAWLFTIARRQLSHFVRHEKVREKYRRRLGISRQVLDAEDLERVEDLADFREVRAQLRAALGDMPVEQAEAVRLRVANELP